MANNTTFHAIPNNVLLCSVVFKFIAMIIGILGNVTVIIYAIFSIKEKTATSYLVGNLALADLLMCLTFYPTWIIEFIQIMLNIDNDQDFFCKLNRATTWAFMSASTATYTSCNYSRSLSICYKTSEVSADCDRSTSVSRCFRNLDNCLLHFHCSVFSSQKLRHLASKCLLLTKQHCLLNGRFYCISSPYFDILPQLPSFVCCAKAT